HDRNMNVHIAEHVTDAASTIGIVLVDQSGTSASNDNDCLSRGVDCTIHDEDIDHVIMLNKDEKKKVIAPNTDVVAMIVGIPVEDRGAVFVYQALDVIDQTKAETTKIIFLAAGIAIVLTTIFAVFLSTRITAPLIKMREAALDLTRGEFNTKVPILTHDEIGELAIAFNRMGRQLNFHINALRQEKEQLSGILSSMADGV